MESPRAMAAASDGGGKGAMGGNIPCAATHAALAAAAACSSASSNGSVVSSERIVPPRPHGNYATATPAASTSKYSDDPCAHIHDTSDAFVTDADSSINGDQESDVDSTYRLYGTVKKEICYVTAASLFVVVNDLKVKFFDF